MPTNAAIDNRFLTVNSSLPRWVDGFLLAKQAGGVSRNTSRIYRDCLTPFVEYCKSRNVITIEAIDATLLREYLLDFATRHNSGGTHQAFRILRTFFRWLHNEEVTERNVIAKVQAPKLIEPLQDPAELETVRALIATCETNIIGRRDAAILTFLMDCGLRAAELCQLNASDFDPVTGRVAVRQGKGGKPRMVFAGTRTRKMIRRYLSDREKMRDDAPLFVTDEGGRLGYWALRSMMTRRANVAGVKPPPLHSFRRLCAVTLARNGVNLMAISRVLGHASVTTTQRYLKLSNADVREMTAQYSPADEL